MTLVEECLRGGESALLGWFVACKDIVMIKTKDDAFYGSMNAYRKRDQGVQIFYLANQLSSCSYQCFQYIHNSNQRSLNY